MQLLKIFTCFAVAVVSSSSLFVQADEFSDLESIHQLFKREDKLPFDSLPAGNCTAPSACSNIGQPATCHCNGILTVCQNTQGQFCWGSKSLNQNTGCPAAPSPCSDSFNGTASCLCNSQAVLCVDQYNHYCYGNIGANSAVSLAAIPTGSQSVMPSASNGLPSNAPTAGSSGSDNANPSSSSSAGSHLTATTLQYSAGVLVTLALAASL
ncbi:hypothetical protein BCR42DRAFT_429831 [Absidia repens]|uniref:Extracellular membrane protein CFEM domain-containing protein n=1 Tax=Absidia repens TaxID=90262 RepID=A0A1X2HR35_9FUNG|nr:hypothetical protein BCR42DRAFT_429831 [Absidia repens]